MASDIIVKVLRLKDEASPQLKVVGESAEDAAEPLDDATESAEGTGESLKEMGAKAGAVVGVVVAVGAAFMKLSQHLADARNELIDTSTRTGLTTQTIAGLKLAAEGSGQQLEALATGLAQFPKRMDDVRRGTGEALVAFEALGISVTDANDNMRSADAVMREVATAIQDVDDPTQRAALAVQAFGEAGNNLMVALGGESLDRFVEDAARFGISVGPDAAEAAGEWQRNLAELSASFDGVVDRMARSTGGSAALTESTTALSATFQSMSAFIDKGTSSFNRFVRSIGAAISAFSVWKVKVASGLLGREVGGAPIVTPEPAGLEVGQGVLRPGFSLGEDLTGTGDLIRTPMRDEDGDGGSGAGGAVSEAERLLATLTRKTAALVGQAFPLTRLEKAEQLIVSLNAARDEATSSQAAALAQLAEDATSARDELRRLEAVKLTEDMAKALEKMGAPLDKAAQSIDRDLVPALESLRQKMIASIFDPITAGIGAIQDPTSLLAAAGPQGAAAGAALGLIQSDPKQIQGTLTGLVDAAKNAGPTLRVILRDFIPTFIAEFPAALVTGLIDALPDIVEAFVVKLPIAIAQNIVNMLQALWDSFRQLILRLIPGRQKGERRREAGVFRRAAASIGDLFRSDEGRARAKQRRGFQTGGFVDRTGMFLLHQNERVIPSSGAVPQSARGMMGGGATQQIVINTNVVDPNSIDQLGRMLQRHFGSMGRSTLPIFGGA